MALKKPGCWWFQLNLYPDLVLWTPELHIGLPTWLLHWISTGHLTFNMSHAKLLIFFFQIYAFLCFLCLIDVNLIFYLLEPNILKLILIICLLLCNTYNPWMKSCHYLKNMSSIFYFSPSPNLLSSFKSLSLLSWMTIKASDWSSCLYACPLPLTL